MGPNIGTFVKIAVVVLFTVLFIAFLVQHGRLAGASAAGDLKPSVTGFLTAIGIFGVLVGRVRGVERRVGCGHDPGLMALPLQGAARHDRKAGRTAVVAGAHD